MRDKFMEKREKRKIERKKNIASMISSIWYLYIYIYFFF